MTLCTFLYALVCHILTSSSYLSGIGHKGMPLPFTDVRSACIVGTHPCSRPVLQQ